MSAPTLNDADWINPIMVRYFRTRLRSRLFVGFLNSFLIVMVVLVTWVAFVSKDDPQAAQRTAGLFVAWMTLPLYFLPLAALDAFRQQVKSKTLELVLITHLRGTKITWGAWQTFFAIALLWKAVLVPVWVIFYFTHGADLVDTFYIVMGTLSTLAPLIMMGLWLGLLSNWWKRIFAGCLWLMGYGFTLTVASVISVSASGGHEGLAATVTALVHGFVATWFTRLMVCDGLIWQTHQDYYYSADAH